MPKISQGRLAGLHGMFSYTSAELVTLADRLEAQVHDPLNTDDPRWLKRWAAKIRRLAAQKERAFEQRARESGP
jgi:hypothetical protein